MYAAIFLVSAGAWLFARFAPAAEASGEGARLRWLTREDNLIAKTLYRPVLLGGMALITLLTL